MDVRADWALELQLEQVHEHAVDRRVKRCVHQAIEHMTSGKGGHRRGGAELIALLAEALIFVAASGGKYLAEL
jgi:hypothetical protein